MTITQFKTQPSLRKHFREIIDRIGICDSLKLKYAGIFRFLRII